MRFTKSLMYDIVVIGGGAAGMMSAAYAAKLGSSVLLIERNKFFGKKLRITGKGRCNVTNNCDVPEALSNIPRGGKFLQSVFYGFTPKSTMEYFEELGVPLKTERGGRVFPVSDKAADIVAALRRDMEKSNVISICARAEGVLTEDGAVSGVKTDKGVFPGKSVILCTGGVSYPLTGSDGDGYKIAQELGHKIVELKPSLVPLTAEPELCSRMQGLALKNIKLTVMGKGKKPVFEGFGELLFTHFGLSGPLVLSASAHMLAGEEYKAVIDLKPALDEKKLDARLLRDFEKYANRDFANALGDLANRLMIPVLIEKSGIPPSTKVNSVTKAQRRSLLEVFKAFQVHVSGFRPIDEAIITSGGVDLKEISPKTMESKLIPGLYFAGEIINADGYTGGFNLQIAWSTARAAAGAAAGMKG